MRQQQKGPDHRRVRKKATLDTQLAVDDAPRSPNPARKRRPQEVKARIAEAATAAFTRHGFAGARMRSIAEDAGITIQLLTHHVKSKENLWKLTVQHLQNKFDEIRVASPTLSPKATPSERLRVMIAEAVHLMATMPQLHRLMTLEAAQLTPRLLYLIETLAQAPFDEMCTVIRDAQRSGAIRKVNPVRLRFAIVAMAAVPFSVAAEYEYFTGRSPFSKSEIEHTIELINSLVFVK